MQPPTADAAASPWFDDADDDTADPLAATWLGRIGVGAAYAIVAGGIALVATSQSHAATNGDDLEFGGLALVIGGVCAVVGAVLSPRRRRHAVAGLVVLLLLGVSLTKVPLDVRWKLSEGAFEQLVRGNPAAMRMPISVGQYDIEQVDTSVDGYLFYDAAFPGDFSDTGDGIAYLPNGDRGAFHDDGFVQLDGPWYAWVGYS